MSIRSSSPPLFSPSHRPILATSASFNRDNIAPSSSASSSHNPHDDPWRQDLPESPTKPHRSLSEGHESVFPTLWSGDNDSTVGGPKLRKRGPGNPATGLESDLGGKGPSKDKGKGRAISSDRDVTELAVEKISVWASMLETSNGRDKILKCFQYSARSYVYLNFLLNSIYKLPPAQQTHIDKLKVTISSLSLTRKCLILFSHLPAIRSLLSPSPISAPQFFLHVLALLNGLADDIYCLSKLGIVSKRRGMWADKWCNRFWLLKSLIELAKLHLILLPALRLTSPDPGFKDLNDVQWTVRKLLCDTIFASYDVFSLTFAKEGVLCTTGLLAGLIGTSKLYEKHLVKVRKG